MRRFVIALVALTLLTATAQADSITHGTTTISMDFVSVGNADNDPDDQVMLGGTTGYGSVDYAYKIGKYEVAGSQWDAVVAADTNDLLDNPGWPGWSSGQPVADISWHEAAMFCNWLTSGDVTLGAYAIDDSGVVTGIDRGSAVSVYDNVYVIPNENEWYKAAYHYASKPAGSGYWDYPTGSDTTPDGIDLDIDTEFDAVFADGYIQDLPNGVDNAGVPSAYGTIGQGGNVWEWNETEFGPYNRFVRGGHWASGIVNLHASYRSRYHPPTYHNSTIGFRVASIPEPSTLVLLAMGAIALLAYAWRRGGFPESK